MPAEPHTSENPAAGPKGSRLRAVRPRDPRAALGMAVSYLMTDPVFARLPFGQWSRVLVGQVNRGHCLFIADGETIVGFAGWAFATKEKAEAWLTNNADIGFGESASGEIVLINAWKAASPQVNRVLVGAFRHIVLDKVAVYAKRFYGNGKIRPLRLTVNDYVARHVERRGRASAASVGEGAQRKNPLSVSVGSRGRRQRS